MAAVTLTKLQHEGGGADKRSSVLATAALACSLNIQAPPVALLAGKGSEIGDYLIMHPGVNAISFTGGDTGISICRKASMVPIQASCLPVLAGN